MVKKKVEHSKDEGHAHPRPHHPHVRHSHKHAGEHHASREHIPKGSLEEQTLHNLVELQKANVNMVERFDKLATQIENLLALFESAARNFAKQPGMQSTEKDKEFLDKIDKLLDQNKVLAKGLTLMEEKMRERVYGASASPPPASQMRPSFRTSPPPQSNTSLEEI
jgi:conjugal transfer/entry exclusion protein